ncbi:unnamed protein product [Cercopithifilaria johnstoni]|uniref:Uncharacterized protein n=1 Tax=Cercopithifilaria johnstoni TaxID=2874296 RepID=A0A8J2MQE5_9BILA|nr:unnamed protein product [Cercopithifilaria johnstoni]
MSHPYHQQIELADKYSRLCRLNSRGGWYGQNGTGWNDMVARNLPECRAHVRKKISTQVRIYGLTVGYLAPVTHIHTHPYKSSLVTTIRPVQDHQRWRGDNDDDWAVEHSNGYRVVPTTPLPQSHTAIIIIIVASTILTAPSSI